MQCSLPICILICMQCSLPICILMYLVLFVFSYVDDDYVALHAKDLKPADDCDTDYTKEPTPLACCSPHCDWLLVYLCVDGTVMKCIDK